MSDDSTPTQWHLYLVRCPDGSLYTGITTDIERRLAAHRDNRGAKRLRGRSPLNLVFSQAVGDRAQALRVECRVKALSKSDKEGIVRGDRALPPVAEG